MTRTASRITINDVARLAGVSKKTVSRVINNSPLLSQPTRDKVAAVIAETGFVPNAQARALALRRNFLVALVSEWNDEAEDGIVAAVRQGLHRALDGSEYALVHRPLISADGSTGFARLLDQHRPSVVVIPPPLSQNDGLAHLCEDAGIACVRLGPLRHAPPLPTDGRAAMSDTVHRLATEGHTRIGLVCGPEGLLLAQERELGFLDAMADLALDRGAMLIEPGDMTFASGLAAGRMLLAVSPRPTAILCCSDAMAAGVLRAAYDQHISVPQDLSVVGFDDTPLAARLCPPLASIAVPWERMAHNAIRSLIAPGQDAGDRTPYKAELVARASLGPAVKHPVVPTRSFQP